MSEFTSSPDIYSEEYWDGYSLSGNEEAENPFPIEPTPESLSFSKREVGNFLTYKSEPTITLEKGELFDLEEASHGTVLRLNLESLIRAGDNLKYSHGERLGIVVKNEKDGKSHTSVHLFETFPDMPMITSRAGFLNIPNLTVSKVIRNKELINRQEVSSLTRVKDLQVYVPGSREQRNRSISSILSNIGFGRGKK